MLEHRGPRPGVALYGTALACLLVAATALPAASAQGVNPDAIRLTDDPAEDRAPAWSPDGARIAFAARAEEGEPADIYAAPVPVRR